MPWLSSFATPPIKLPNLPFVFVSEYFFASFFVG
jgi:hypothetical protein